MVALAEIHSNGFGVVGLAAAMAVAFNDARIFSECINYTLDHVPDHEARQWGSLSWCEKIPESMKNYDNRPVASRAKKNFIDLYQKLSVTDLELIREARKYRITLPKKNSQTLPDLDDFKKAQESLDIALANRLLTHDHSFDRYERFHFSDQESFNIQWNSMKVVLEIAQKLEKSDPNSKGIGNCWQFLNHVVKEAGGKSALSHDSTRMPNWTEFHSSLTGSRKPPEYKLSYFRYPNVADHVIPPGAVLLFALNDGTEGHVALYARKGKCIGKNYPSGTGIRTLDVANIYQYDTVRIVMPNRFF